jgi:hypothetical protein
LGPQLLGQNGLTGLAFCSGLATGTFGCWQAAVASVLATRNNRVSVDFIGAMIAAAHAARSVIERQIAATIVASDEIRAAGCSDEIRSDPDPHRLTAG